MTLKITNAFVIRGQRLEKIRPVNDRYVNERVARRASRSHAYEILLTDGCMALCRCYGNVPMRQHIALASGAPHDDDV